MASRRGLTFAAGLAALALPPLFAGPALADQLVAYGQYLSNECTACHKPGATQDGIPDIAGRDADELVALLKLYKSGERESDAMVSVARSLDEEQIKALAAYYAAKKETQ